MKKIAFICLAMTTSMLLVSCRVTISDGIENGHLTIKENKTKSLFSHNVDLQEVERRKQTGYTESEIKDLLENKTLLFVDYVPKLGLFHQIEYYGADGSSYLWYPKNSSVVKGKWETKGNRTICFTYSENSYNPHTGVKGAVPECEEIATWNASVIDRNSGDMFALKSMRLPRKLEYGVVYKNLQEVKDNTGFFLGRKKGH